MRAAVISLCAAFLAVTPCHAERADRDKPVNIEADRMTADNTKQVAVFEGRVVLTQGTFTLRADRLTVQQDKDGNQSGVALGKPATFRQKRDGVDEWVDGEASRIEYDGKNERVELFDQARVSRDKDEVRGDYISYDSRGEFYEVKGAKSQAEAKSRVRAVIQPKKRGEEASGAPLNLKPAPALGGKKP